VRGHVYVPSSGNPALQNIKEIIVDVQRSIGAVSPSSSRRSLFILSGLFTCSILNNSIMILEDIAEGNEEESSASDDTKSDRRKLLDTVLDNVQRCLFGPQNRRIRSPIRVASFVTLDDFCRRHVRDDACSTY